MSLSPEEFHKLLRQAVSRAKRSAPPWLDTEDLTQSAELAMLEAQRKGHTFAHVDPTHLKNATRQKLWGAMMDSIRTAYDGSRSRPAPLSESLHNDEGELVHEQVAPDNPMRTVQLKRAVERFGRKGTIRQQEVVLLIAAGHTDKEAGDIMGISESRVSQLKGEARKIMSMWGDL